MVDPSLVLDLAEKALKIVQKGAEYKSTRKTLKSTAKELGPVVEQMEQCIKDMDLPTREIENLKKVMAATQEVLGKYSKIRWWNCFLAPFYQSKLEAADRSLVRYSSVQVQMQMARDIKFIARDLKEILSKLSPDDDRHRRSQSISTDQEVNNNSRTLSFKSNLEIFPEFTVGLDGPIMGDLKHKLLEDSDDKVLNLYGLPGSGKTTLAKELCRDLQVKGKFNNIIFKTLGSQIQSSDAIKQLQDGVSMFGGNPVLLVLDDVWPGSQDIAEQLRDRISSDSKILVTSRVAFPELGTTYPMKQLSEDDAVTLFLHFVRPSNIDVARHEVREILLKIVKGCKGLPLALKFIGRQLRGKRIKMWQKVELEWSQGHSVLDSDTELLKHLQNTLRLLEDKSTYECFMDLGLFPEDQRIPVAALIDMWIELYNLDEDGIYAMTFIDQLTDMNFAAGVIVRKKVGGEADNYYDNHFLVQHDLFRELAIRICNQEPFETRKRLIIDMNGNKRPEWLMEPKQQRVAAARILSLSIPIDQNITPYWCNMLAAEAEVLVLNLQTKEYTSPEFIPKTKKVYTLPEFKKEMRKLKVLIVTDYGFYPTELRNLELLVSLSSLKRIRLEQVSLPYFCELKNLQKLSLFMCEVKKAFESSSIQLSEAMPNLADLNIEYCKDMVKLPAELCKIVTLKKLSISSCHKVTELPQEIGKLENLELLRVSYCANFEEIPESITRLQRLSFLDISYCVSLKKLPENIGELRNLRKLYMTGCLIHELPVSVIDMKGLNVVICDDYTYPFWEIIKYNHPRLNVEVAKDITLNWLPDFGYPGFFL